MQTGFDVSVLIAQLQVPRQTGGLPHTSSPVGQTPTVVDVVEVLVDVLVEVLDELLVELELVVVVAETQAEPVLNESAVGQPPEHA